MTGKPSFFAIVGALLAGTVWFYTRPNIDSLDLMMTIPIVILGGMIGGLIGSLSELKAKTNNVPKAFIFTPFTTFLLVVGVLFLLGGVALQAFLGLPGDNLFVAGGIAIFIGGLGSTNIRADR